MSQSLADRKNNFRIQIRKKTVQDKLSKLRANFQKQQKQQQFNQERLTILFNECLQSIQKLIQNIPKLKYLSYSINTFNLNYFTRIIPQLWYLVQKIDDLKESTNIKNKNQFYNDLLTILINVSTQYHSWPKISYLPLIKNVIIKQRQINTLWLLSNLLYQKSNQNTQLSKYLIEQLIQYEAIDYCELRINKTFQQQKNSQIFSFYVCSFLSNSNYLSFTDHKKIVKLIQKLTEINNQMIDYFILDSMIDHAPNLKQKDYHLLYSEIIKKFSQIYLKKKKTKMVLKYLQFVKTYIFSQIKQALLDKEDIQSSQIDPKIARANYQRILLTTIPNLTICLQNRSPEVKEKLAQICSMLLVYYFPYIDVQNQQIFLSLVVELKNSSISIICKYSNKALYWLIKYAIIFLEKIKQFKISKQIISQFISKNGILNALAVLLKQKSSQLQIIREIIQLLNILLEEIDQAITQEQITKISLQQITKMLDLILQSNLIKQEKLFTKIRYILDICDKYT